MPLAVSWQRFEGGLIFIASMTIYWLNAGIMPWWMAALVFFAPDLSFSGYLLGPRAGSSFYNAVHLYACGIAVIAIGLAFVSPMIMGLGALWLSHAGLDRLLGYGLKLSEGFTFTHLGRTGNAR